MSTQIKDRVTMLREMIQKEVANGGNVVPFHMVRDAKNMEVEFGVDAKGHNVVHVGFGNGMSHTFNAKSRVSQHVNDTPRHKIEERLKTGAYFFVEHDNKMGLVDFTLDADRSFIHSDRDIQSLMETIGVTPVDEKSRFSKALRGNTQHKGLYLGSAYSTEDMSIDLLNGNVMGGEFNSLLRYKWSPFSEHVNSMFELIRLICANGAIGLANFLNTKVPLVNMWQENLEIASRQIQSLVQQRVTNRLSAMSREPANVAVLTNLLKHVERRLTNPDIENTQDALLRGIARVVDPEVHLGHIYKTNVFEDMRVAEQFAGHLSKMDAWNIATEIASHTQEMEESTTNALNKVANGLMFFDKDYKSSKFIESPFSSADNAFFGQIAA